MKKKVAIRIEFDDKCYTSIYHEVSDEEIKKLELLCQKAAKGELKLLQFESNNLGGIIQFFSKNILEKSVFSLIYQD